LQTSLEKGIGGEKRPKDRVILMKTVISPDFYIFKKRCCSFKRDLKGKK
jgi:hypothetical protein